jgi:hypothetical protein
MGFFEKKRDRAKVYLARIVAFRKDLRVLWSVTIPVWVSSGG